MNERGKRDVLKRAALAGGVIAALAVTHGWSAAARGGSAEAVGPDVTVFNLTGPGNYTAVGGFEAYSLGTTSCNQGDVPLNWCNNTGGCGAGTTDEDHPVIAQNLYRLKDGRFEQIGMSWLKHGFFSVNSSSAGCGDGSCDSPPLGGDQLGVGCTDPYGSSLNGSRPLGMRSEVDATTGVFPYPYTEVTPGDSTEQRIRVAVADVDPAQNPGALYFAEGHYVTPDDAAAENALNNASYRQTFVDAGTLSLDFDGAFPTVREQPAIAAWQAVDPLVELVNVDVPGSSPTERFHAARKVTPLGGGGWHFEYAVHNLNSDRSARSFTVTFPVPTSITNAGFHGIAHHSGEPYSTVDWTIDTGTPNTVSWSTDSFAVEPNANALRWGTMFTFWFDTDVYPPGMQHTLGLFKPGSPSSVGVGFIDAPVFSDGFESGDTSAWTLVDP